MSDMNDLKMSLATVAASLQVLAANTTANTQDLENNTQDLHRVSESLEKMSERVKRMSERSRETEEAVQQLRGTFASIETHLVSLFERDAETQTWKAAMEARVEALEKKQPPAACRGRCLRYVPVTSSPQPATGSPTCAVESDEARSRWPIRHPPSGSGGIRPMIAPA